MHMTLNNSLTHLFAHFYICNIEIITCALMIQQGFLSNIEQHVGNHLLLIKILLKSIANFSLVVCDCKCYVPYLGHLKNSSNSCFPFITSYSMDYCHHRQSWKIYPRIKTRSDQRGWWYNKTEGTWVTNTAEMLLTCP